MYFLYIFDYYIENLDGILEILFVAKPKDNFHLDL